MPAEEARVFVIHQLFLPYHQTLTLTVDILDSFPLQAINRTLLKWLKLWDKVVFNKSKGVNKSKNTKHTKENEKEKLNQHGKGNKKFKKGIESEEWIVSTVCLIVRTVAK